MRAYALATLAVVAGMLAAAHDAAAQKAGKKLYCWNENGTRVCGDVLPPEQAARARTEISANSGRPTTRIQRALTEEERAAAEAAASRERLAAEAETARARRDLAMVASYATEADLQRAFHERIALVDASIRASVLGEANLRRGLVGLLGQAADLELIRKPVPRPLQDNILKRHAELGRQRQILRQQHAERTTLNGDLAGALQRYRVLKAAQADAAEMAARH